MPDKPKPLKQPFYITRRDGLPLTFAGLWERWKDGFLSCAILTTEAAMRSRYQCGSQSHTRIAEDELAKVQ